jgi:cytochrome c oxidase cbb3-type subunit 3
MRVLALLLVLPLLAACEREDRNFRPSQMGTQSEPQIMMGSLSPGGQPSSPPSSGEGRQYEANAYQVAQGKTNFAQFNCNGCHANGGGGSGPALMDDKWIYGGSIDNIAQTIREGRPNGMPSFRKILTEEQVWQLAAYVRSLSGNVSKDVAPGRNDDLNPHPAESRLPPQPPANAGNVPQPSPGAQ